MTSSVRHRQALIIQNGGIYEDQHRPLEAHLSEAVSLTKALLSSFSRSPWGLAATLQRNLPLLFPDSLRGHSARA
jgi:hypothetical protein